MIRDRQGLWGWLFVTPALVILGLFMVIPIALALWVSFRSWSGLESPFGSGSTGVGFDNYTELLAEPGLAQRDFARGLRNNLYYVLGVVPVQTFLAFFLALVLHQKVLRARGFFRSAFYFPSITSSVAVALVFLAIFQPNGVLNQTLAFFGLDGPVWLDDPRGLVHIVSGWFGVTEAPGFLTGRFMGLAWWDWLSGPSVTLTAIMAIAAWTTIGTFMLMFLAGLQNLPRELDEAAIVDGAGRWQLFWRVTLPQMRPTLFLVLTLGLIGTWQVFDQIFVISDGGPEKTTLTPAYLVYVLGFETRQMGLACAVAFLLFVIIVGFTLIQRRLLRER